MDTRQCMQHTLLQTVKLLHMDLMGPMLVHARGGYRCVLTNLGDEGCLSGALLFVVTIKI